MIKFLIILTLAVYILYKIGSWFFRVGAASQQFRNQQTRNFNGKASSPNPKKTGSGFKGGEYVDYEEVK